MATTGTTVPHFQGSLISELASATTARAGREGLTMLAVKEPGGRLFEPISTFGHEVCARPQSSKARGFGNPNQEIKRILLMG